MTRGGDIERLLRQGTRLRGRYIDLHFLDTDAGAARAGVIVAKLQHSAVARNVVKRRLRELVRTVMLPSLGSRDILVRARREAFGASYDALRADVRAVLSKAPERP